MSEARADVRVPRLAVPEDGGLMVHVHGTLTVAIFRVDDQYYAIDNRCPHKGGPFGEGALTGPVVRCPWHGFRVDVRTGRCPHNPTLRVQTFPVVQEGDMLRVVTTAPGNSAQPLMER